MIADCYFELRRRLFSVDHCEVLGTEAAVVVAVVVFGLLTVLTIAHLPWQRKKFFE